MSLVRRGSYLAVTLLRRRNGNMFRVVARTATVLGIVGGVWLAGKIALGILGFGWSLLTFGWGALTTLIPLALVGGAVYGVWQWLKRS